MDAQVGPHEPPRLRYWPNPAHKREYTEAGPPRWRAGKTPCPSLTPTETNQLLQESVPDPKNPAMRRFAMRRDGGAAQWFEGKRTEIVDDVAIFHGYPTDYVPATVLRRFRDAQRISEAEYREMVRRLA